MPKSATPPTVPAPLPREWAKGSLKRIREWMAAGATEGGVARRLGMSPSTFARLKSRDDRVAAAVEEGRERNLAFHVERLTHPEKYVDLDPRTSPGPWAALLKARQLASLAALNARHGWRTEVPAEGGKVAVTINLPAPAKPEDYRAQARVITVAKETPNA